MSFEKLFKRAQKKKKMETKKAESPAVLQQERLVATTTGRPSSRKRRGGAGPWSVDRPSARSSRTVDDDEPDEEDYSSSSSSTKKRRKRKGPPSQAALALSQQLQDLSRQKRLSQALELYWHHHHHQHNTTDNNNKKNLVVDEHHACILVDCCARCGNMDEAEKIFYTTGATTKNNVPIQTAMLKGYAHAGEMSKAEQLFTNMIVLDDDTDNSNKNKRCRPNVRTLNTVLRGCLWTAATFGEEDSSCGNNKVSGGVVTSERVWKLFRKHVGQQALDSCSYEYSIVLLCQALRVDEAKDRMEEFQNRHGIRIKGKASFVGGDQTTLETLAVTYLALSRAFALLGRPNDVWLACQRVLNAVNGSRARLLHSQPDDDGCDVPQQSTKKRVTAGGGKRSWSNNSEAHKNARNAQRRAASNVSFRNHKLTELETEARKLLKMRGKGKAERLSAQDLSKRLLTQLFYFSGGGTTDLAATQSTEAAPDADRREDRRWSIRQSLTSLWFSFGLSQVLEGRRATYEMKDAVDPSIIYDLAGVNERSYFPEDGPLDLDYLFRVTDSGTKDRPVDIELGAGFGDWVVAQAQSHPERNYVAVELRADRVSQIFYKVLLESSAPLDNVCVVGSECGSYLRRLKACSISTIFANHPEPPTQTYGDDRADLQSIMSGGNEPAHMLNSSTIQAAAECLKDGGKMIIVTDNKWYARFLGATFVKVTRKHLGLLRPPKRNELPSSGLRQIETFGDGAVDLYEGRPSSAIGHNTSEADGGGSTWFDRLWRTGAGSHAERKTRFVIIMQRC